MTTELNGLTGRRARLAVALATLCLVAIGQSAHPPDTEGAEGAKKSGVRSCGKKEIRRKAFLYDVTAGYTRSHTLSSPGIGLDATFKASWSYEAVALKVRRCRKLIKVVLRGGRNDVGTASYSGSETEGGSAPCTWSFELAPIGVLTLRGLLDTRARARGSQGLIGEARNRYPDHLEAFTREYGKQMNEGCLADRQDSETYYDAGSLGGTFGSQGSFLTFGPATPAVQFRLPLADSVAPAAARFQRRVPNRAIRKLLRGKPIALASAQQFEEGPDSGSKTSRASVSIELEPADRARRPSLRLGTSEARSATRSEACEFEEIASAECAGAEGITVDGCERQSRRRVTCHVDVQRSGLNTDGEPSQTSCFADVFVIKASDGRVQAAYPAWTCAVA